MLLLPLIVFLPIAFLILEMILGERHSYKISLASSIITLLLLIGALSLANANGFTQVSFSVPYIRQFNIDLTFQLSAYTQILTLMTAIIFVAAAAISNSLIKNSQKFYNALFLILSSFSIGIFLSGNLLMFCAFLILSEVTLFFMIYVFGGYNRRYAAIKFLTWSIISSFLLLIGILAIYANSPTHTFDINALARVGTAIPGGVQILVLITLLLSFMIKMPAFPFHNWLPDVQAEAPTPTNMILSGVLANSGGYGLFLLFQMMPNTSGYALYLAALFGFSAIYSALVALRQAHLNRTIAYVSTSYIGIIALGIVANNAYGVSGAFYSMLSRGIIISLLFLVAGALDESFGSLLINSIKGVARSMKNMAYIFMFGVFALAGMPLTSSFIGYLLIFTGAYSQFGAVLLTPLAAVLVSGSYLFFLLEKRFFNMSKAIEPYAIPDKSIIYACIFLIAVTLLLGIMPNLLLKPITAL